MSSALPLAEAQTFFGHDLTHLDVKNLRKSNVFQPSHAIWIDLDRFGLRYLTCSANAQAARDFKSALLWLDKAPFEKKVMQRREWIDDCTNFIKLPTSKCGYNWLHRLATSKMF